MEHNNESDRDEDNSKRLLEGTDPPAVVVKVPEESLYSLQKCYKNESLRAVSISWHGLSYVIRRSIKKGYVTILKDITGESKAGELTAILGASGSGKTTLLNILVGLIQRQVAGKIMVNGKERRLKTFQHMMCYIQHENDVLPDLSLKESLFVAANLKLPKNISREEKCRIIKESLAFWGLSDSEDTMVNKLSSGQKKRLSIAQEVISKPPLIFLDEPTSGLDSLSCVKCITMLKNLAHQGHNVICSIHQPTALHFEQFDRVCFINQGECLYNGPRNNLLSFLSECGLECPIHHNPADFVIEAVLGEYGEGKAERLILANAERYQRELTSSSGENDSKLELPLQEKYGANRKAIVNNGVDKGCTKKLLRVEKEEDRSCGYQTSLCNQFLVLFGRAVLCITRSSTVIHILLSSQIAIALAIGLLYYEIGNDAGKILDNVSCLFFCMLFVSFSSSMSAILTIPIEMPVIKREILNRWYPVKAYYFARSLADIPLQIIFPAVFGSIAYWMTGQINDAARFVLFLCLLIMTALISQTFGLIIGVLCRIQVSVFLAPVGVLLPPLLFCGFYIRIGVIPSYLRWITYISFYRYSFEGIMLANYGFNRTALECTKERCLYDDLNYFLDDMGMGSSKLHINFLILAAFIVILRIFTFFVLNWKTTKAS